MKKRSRKSSKTKYIPIIVLAIVVVFGIQLYSLWGELSEARAREESLVTQLEEAKSYSDELTEYEEYIQSEEFISNTAHSKLGLVKENEIIFKQR